MITFSATIKKFKEHGDKTGWTYIEIPFDIAEKINPGTRKSFKVKGTIDKVEINGLSLLPQGEGNFILALNAAIRKKIKKSCGETIAAAFVKDDTIKKINEELIECLEDAPEAMEFFKTLPKSHQRYFSDWVESAKTAETKTKRIVQCVNALSVQLGFSQMIRINQGKER